MVGTIDVGQVTPGIALMGGIITMGGTME